MVHLPPDAQIDATTTWSPWVSVAPDQWFLQKTSLNPGMTISLCNGRNRLPEARGLGCLHCLTCRYQHRLPPWRSDECGDLPISRSATTWSWSSFTKRAPEIRESEGMPSDQLLVIRPRLQSHNLGACISIGIRLLSWRLLDVHDIIRLVGGQQPWQKAMTCQGRPRIGAAHLRHVPFPGHSD